MFDPQSVDNKFTVIKRRDFVSQTGRGLALIGAVGGVCKRLWEEDRRINYSLFVKKCLYTGELTVSPQRTRRKEFAWNIGEISRTNR
jgi:hypothetical protein